MQTLTRAYMVVIEDWYDNNGWKFELDETNKSLVKIFSKSLNPLLYLYLYFKKN